MPPTKYPPTYKSITKKYLQILGAIIGLSVLYTVFFVNSDSGSGMELLLVIFFVIPGVVISWIISLVSLRTPSQTQSLNSAKANGSATYNNRQVTTALFALVFSVVLIMLIGIFESELRNISDGIVSLGSLLAQLLFFVSIVRLVWAYITSRHP